MRTILLTCPKCGSGIHFLPEKGVNYTQCDVCKFEVPLKLSSSIEQGIVDECPQCKGTNFYIQKDFNRKIGVILFIIASILAIFTYGISFIVLYVFDFLLFRKLKYIVVCYNCSAIFKNFRNWDKIAPFDHETNDRIVYSTD